MTFDLSERVKSSSGPDGRASVARVLHQSGKEEATVEKSSHEIWPGVFPTEKKKKKLLWSDETQIELFGHQTGPNTAHNSKKQRENYDWGDLFFRGTSPSVQQTLHRNGSKTVLERPS